MHGFHFGYAYCLFLLTARWLGFYVMAISFVRFIVWLDEKYMALMRRKGWLK